MGSFPTETSAAKAHDVAALRLRRESSAPTEVPPTPPIQHAALSCHPVEQVELCIACEHLVAFTSSSGSVMPRAEQIHKKIVAMRVN